MFVNQTSLYASVAQARPELIIFAFLKYRKHADTHTHTYASIHINPIFLLYLMCSSILSACGKI